MQIRPAIIVLAYNRAKALKRLLTSIDAADFPSEVVLVISLEGGASEEVIAVAEKFLSVKLDVRILQREQRLGLRAHVVACADLVSEYESVIILEDDLMVDRYFYQYASHGLHYYRNEGSVAGLSLYGYEHNEFSKLPFRPMQNGYSTYAMQVPSSWGQCWTRAQWNNFKAWYAGKSPGDLESIDGLPESVKSWPESSWKKYFHGYIVDTDKVFIYPYSSYTTNCSDAGGTHGVKKNTIVQASLPSFERPMPKFDFCPASNREVAYDGYMEPVGDFVYRALDMRTEDCAIDLQGIKPIAYLKKWEFVITSRQLSNYMRKYPYDFRPPEQNLRFPDDGYAEDGWVLVRTALLNESERCCSVIGKFNYYSGMNLVAREPLMALLRALPASIRVKVQEALGKVFNH